MSTGNRTLDSISRIEGLLVHGSVAAARAELVELCKTRVPREQLATVANLARRAFMPDKSLRLLHGVVRPPSNARKVLKATDAEKAEYAGALIYVGANEEALKLLAEIDRKAHPIADLFEAFARSRTWDFDGAIAPLESHASNPNVNEVGRLRGRFEFAAALVDGRIDFERAAGLLEELLAETGSDRFRIIHKDSLLLFAQCRIFQKKWSLATECLDKLARLSEADHDPVFSLLTEKWRSILVIARRPESPEANEALRELRRTRERLIEARRYEDARSCDYHEAVLRNDDKLMARLYFGTSYPAFKKRVREHISDPSRLMGAYEWPLLRGSRPETTINVVDGTHRAGGPRLKNGDLPQRLLQILSLDFYRPLHGAELHERLYPGEHFNPDTSPDKLHQALRRLRAWIRHSKLPLEVVESGSFYRLVAREPVALRVREDSAKTLHVASATEARVHTYGTLLRGKFAERNFSASDAAGVLGTSSRSTVRYLAALRDLGLIGQVKSGPRTHYRLK